MFPAWAASSSDDKVSRVAKNFMSGSTEIMRILREFTHRWCPSAKKKDSLHIKNHEKFLHDTDELFEIVLQRIQDETEHLYPLVRSLDK